MKYETIRRTTVIAVRRNIMNARCRCRHYDPPSFAPVQSE